MFVWVAVGVYVGVPVGVELWVLLGVMVGDTENVCVGPLVNVDEIVGVGEDVGVPVAGVEFR